MLKKIINTIYIIITVTVAIIVYQDNYRAIAYNEFCSILLLFYSLIIAIDLIKNVHSHIFSLLYFLSFLFSLSFDWINLLFLTMRDLREDFLLNLFGLSIHLILFSPPIIYYFYNKKSMNNR